MSSSLQLLIEAEKRGLLTKEAAAQILDQREDLIKIAMREVATDLVMSIKVAGIGSIIDRFRKAPEAIKPVAKASGGFLSKLREGGRTGGEGGTGWSDVVGNLGKMMALAGLSAGATAGVQGIMRHRRDSKLNTNIESSYKSMFEEYPRLKDLEEKHPGRIARHFGVLSQFAPSLAAVPTVAGAFVQQSAQMEMISTGEIKNLAETQSRIDEMNQNRHGVRGLSPLQVGTFATKAMNA